jgi:hypothetical protein
LKDEKDNDKEQEKEKDKDPKKGFQAGVKNFLEMVDHNEKMQRRGR